MDDVTTEGPILSLVLENLASGGTYLIQVAAHTGAGMGPFSTPPITQTTFSALPSLNDVTGFEVGEGGITQTTIPVTLPDIPNVEVDFR